MTLAEAMALVHQRSLDFRSLDRLVQGDEFREAWNQASREDQERIYASLFAGNADSVKNWIRSINQKTLEELSFRELRRKASQANIVNYSRMSRDQLLEALKGE